MKKEYSFSNIRRISEKNFSTFARIDDMKRVRERRREENFFQTKHLNSTKRVVLNGLSLRIDVTTGSWTSWRSTAANERERNALLASWRAL